MYVLLVDDHALMRDGTALFLRQRFGPVDVLEAESLAQALAHLRRVPQVDLVLLDLHLRDADGAEAVRRLREQAPGVPIVALSADSRPEWVEAALQAGARGFVAKTAKCTAFEVALRRVLAGEDTQLLSGGAVGAGPAAGPVAPATDLGADAAAFTQAALLARTTASRQQLPDQAGVYGHGSLGRGDAYGGQGGPAREADLGRPGARHGWGAAAGVDAAAAGGRPVWALPGGAGGRLSGSGPGPAVGDAIGVGGAGSHGGGLGTGAAADRSLDELGQRRPQRIARVRAQAVHLLAQELGLAPRQIEVLQLMLEGEPNKGIARSLDLAESTVKSHVLAIFRKLGVSGRAEAMVRAAQNGLYEY